MGHLTLFFYAISVAHTHTHTQSTSIKLRLVLRLLPILAAVNKLNLSFRPLDQPSGTLTAASRPDNCRRFGSRPCLRLKRDKATASRTTTSVICQLKDILQHRTRTLDYLLHCCLSVVVVVAVAAGYATDICKILQRP